MTHTTIHINDASFVLEDEVSTDDLRTEIETAARSGAQFIELRTRGGGQMPVLVTPHLLIRLSVSSDIAVAIGAVGDSKPWPAAVAGTDYDL